MTQAHGKKTKIYVDEFNISGDSNSVESAGTVDTAETSTMGNNSKEYLPGLDDDTLSIGGYFSNGTGGMDDVIDDYRTGSETAILTYCPEGVADSAIVYTTEGAICTGVNTKSSLTGAVTMDSTWQTSGGKERMLVVYEGTITATTTGAAVDFGSAGTALAGAAVIHFTALAGSGTLNVHLHQSSDNDGDTYDDLTDGDFTELTAIGSERITWDGACEEYVKAVMTVSGFTSCTVLVVAKIGGTAA
jgi:hypothetical protein